jgi:hypothetical protein
MPVGVFCHVLIAPSANLFAASALMHKMLSRSVSVVPDECALTSCSNPLSAVWRKRGGW